MLTTVPLEKSVRIFFTGFTTQTNPHFWMGVKPDGEVVPRMTKKLKSKHSNLFFLFFQVHGGVSFGRAVCINGTPANVACQCRYVANVGANVGPANVGIGSQGWEEAREP